MQMQRDIIGENIRGERYHIYTDIGDERRRFRDRVYQNDKRDITNDKRDTKEKRYIIEGKRDITEDKTDIMENKTDIMEDQIDTFIADKRKKILDTEES